MGKLGKKARKFAKKNLQSVLRDRRKNKPKPFSRKKKEPQHQHQHQHLSPTHIPISNSNSTFEDSPLDAPFLLATHTNSLSDSDGYLSQDSISSESEADSNPLQADNCISELTMQNIKIQEDLANQKRKLQKLKRKDPSFSKFLERYQNIEAQQNGEMFSDDDEMSNHRGDLLTEDNRGKSKGKVLTASVISSWCRLIKEEKDEAALVRLLNAYRAACHYGFESIGLKFQSVDTFCSLVMSVLSEAENIFHRLLGLSSSSDKKEAILKLKDTPEWVNVKPLIKTYIRSTLSLLDHVTDSDILAFALTRFRASLPFFAAFPYLLQRLIKTTVHLWATSGGLLSSMSFSVVREVASQFTVDCFDCCLAKAFVAYLVQSRATEVDSLHLQFMRNSLVDLCALDVQKSLSKATSSARQLAKILQWGLQTKKMEALKRICSWEYINCVDLWVGFIVANIQDYDLRPFFFTIVQLINGVIDLFPGQRYFPLRLKCIQWLNDLSNATGVFIPIASYVMDVLEYKIVREGGKPGPALSFQSVLKLPKNCLKSRMFQDESISSAIEQLTSHFLQWSYHISFPELATFPLIRLKKFNETKTKESLCRAVKHLIEQVEKNVDFVQKRRDEVSFSPNDHQSVDSFLQFEKSGLCSSFTQHYRSVLEKAVLRGSQQNDEISSLGRERSKHKRDAHCENGVSDDKDMHAANGTKRVKRRAL